MKLTRRDLIKGGAAGALGVVLLSSGITPLLKGKARAAAANPNSKADEYDWDKHTYGFVVDTTKCIGCGKCAVACKNENRVPPEPEFNRTWIERYVITESGETFVDSPEGGIKGFVGVPQNVKYQQLDIADSFFVPKLCNQCENPPCVQVCPVGATYKTADGIVLVDQKWCIGCRYCIQACPYGARYLVPPGADVSPTGYTKVADKCTWCYHRITQGLPPACVEMCPVGARTFGDMRDENSPVRKLLREKRISVLKPTLGTKPKVYYVGLRLEVR